MSEKRKPVDIDAFAAEALATFCARIGTDNEQPPTAYVIERSGSVSGYLLQNGDLAEKRAVQAALKHFCRESGTLALLVVHDTWYRRVTKGQPDPPAGRSLAEDPDRQEAVLATLCTPRRLSCRNRPYTRTPDGIIWDDEQAYPEEGAQYESAWDPWQATRAAN